MTARQPSAVLAAWYARALDVAAVIVVAGWHIGGAGSLLLAHLGVYGSGLFQAIAWSVLALEIAAGAIRLLRGLAGRGPAWALAGGALVISTAVAATCPPGRMLETNWAWGTAGWVMVLVLLRRPLAELGAALSLEALATFGVLVHDGLHRQGLAAFVTILYASVSLQLAVAIAVRAVGIPARQAAEAAARAADVTARRVIAGRVRAARYSRWLALHETAEPLLADLAAGTTDPGDPGVRRSCAVQAAGLRRLFAESDDSPDSLIHELHACADVAERRGVAVDIETAAAVPLVPADARRALTDMAIAVLMTADRRARITVTGAGGGLIVSLISDSLAEPVLALPLSGIVVERQRDGQDLWLEARWNVQ